MVCPNTDESLFTPCILILCCVPRIDALPCFLLLISFEQTFKQNLVYSLIIFGRVIYPFKMVCVPYVRIIIMSPNRRECDILFFVWIPSALVSDSA